MPYPPDIPAEHFVGTLAVNVDNDKLDDAAFRQMVRNTLPIVQGANYSCPNTRSAASQFDDRDIQR